MLKNPYLKIFHKISNCTKRNTVDSEFYYKKYIFNNLTMEVSVYGLPAKPVINCFLAKLLTEFGHLVRCGSQFFLLEAIERTLILKLEDNLTTALNFLLFVRIGRWSMIYKAPYNCR